MQKVAKEEFSPAPDYPELYVKTIDKEYTLQEGNYIFINVTIYGGGEIKLLESAFQPFEGKISLKDVENIKMIKSDNDSDTSELLITTKDKEFIFKSELSSYSVKNDTIIGIGKCKQRINNESFESEVAININDAEEIQINKFNLLNTILISYVAVSVVSLIIVSLTSYVSILSD